MTVNKQQHLNSNLQVIWTAIDLVGRKGPHLLFIVFAVLYFWSGVCFGSVLCISSVMQHSNCSLVDFVREIDFAAALPQEHVNLNPNRNICRGR